MTGSLSELRQHALDAYLAAVEAVQPSRLIPRAVEVRGHEVAISGAALPEAHGRRLLVALGKAAPGLAAAWLDILPDWPDEVFVLVPHGVPVSAPLEARATVCRGAHPYPDAAGEASARRLLAVADSLGDGDLMLVLLSGGASALLAAPEDGLLLEEVRETTRTLLRAGAPITAVNTVRRQLLAAAGGGLARSAFPARVVTLVLSDVLGDSLPDIASGPTVPSPTTAADALAALQHHLARDAIPDSVTRFLASHAANPGEPDPGWAEHSRTVLLANNRTAVAAATVALARDVHEVIAPPRPVTGEASVRGRQLGALAASMRATRRTALVLGGETTVTVRGNGRGGRCQELALAAALELEESASCALLAAGTDGLDGLSDHAGAVVDPWTCRRLRARSIDPVAALADNASGPAVAASGDAILTGPTGTNVCDLVIVLVDAT